VTVGAQSRRASAAEAAVNAVLGFAISSAIGVWGFGLSPVGSAAMTAACTAASIVRGYVVRRVFEGMRK
jgi:hypothetical protein